MGYPSFFIINATHKPTSKIVSKLEKSELALTYVKKRFDFFVFLDNSGFEPRAKMLTQVKPQRRMILMLHWSYFLLGALLIQPIDKITLADGTAREIKLKDKWFENLEMKKAFKNIIVATRVDKTKSVLRFFFIHPSYFRAFEEFGLPLLFMPVVANYNQYQNRIVEVIQSSKERANLEFTEFTKSIFPIFVEVVVKPLLQWIGHIEPTQKSEEEIKKEFVFEAISKMEETTTDKKVVRKFVKRHVSPEMFSQALGLGKTVFNLFSNTLTEKGLERYKLLTDEMCDNNMELCENATNAMCELNMVTPLATVSVCMNKHCKHIELTISDRVPEAKCGKCNSKTLSTTFTFINEPYLWLKDKMLDLHAFLYSYIESKSTQEYIDGKLTSNLRCFLNAYVCNTVSRNQREIDALIYSPTTRKVTAIEIKIHQIRSQLPQDRLRSILRDDLKQLIEILQQTSLKTGCYITNLEIPDEEIQNIKDNLIPEIIAGNDKKDVEVISFIDEIVFLGKLDKLIDSIRSEDD